MANPPYDQWGNPLPNNAGPKRINKSDGTCVPIRSNLKLTSDFTVTDSPDTDETILDVGGSPAAQPVLISALAPSAALSIPSATFTAEAYKKIVVDFDLTSSAFQTFDVKFNADAAGNYQDMQQYTQGVVGAWRTSDFGGNGFATIAFFSSTAGGKVSGHLEIDPRVGTKRIGTCTSYASGAASATSFLMQSGIAWSNTATGLTSITFQSNGVVTFTGKITVYGIPA